MLLTQTDSFAEPPKKIISLVPSQTELLHYLGLEDKVTGITKFCVHPQSWFRTKTRIGGTKTLNIELIKKLQPDLIIANKEENVKEQVEELAKDFPVWVTDVNNLDEAFAMIEDIGNLTSRKEKSLELTGQIQQAFSELEKTPNITAAYLIWKDPYMAAGGDTFISDLMARSGLQNVFQNKMRYPEVTVNDLVDAEAEVILLSSEPYPFKEKHAEELNRLILAKAKLRDIRSKIICVDGEMFSWYGSRLLHTAGYLQNLKHNILK